MHASDEGQIKEVFALFGAAYYHSECLHRGLCNFYALGTFEEKAHITRPRIEEKLARAFALTLGQIVGEVRTLLPEELYNRLQQAVAERNFLAHHFWFERIHLTYSTDGLQEMVRELTQLINLFNLLDEEITLYFEPIRTKLGIANALIEQAQAIILAGEDKDILLRQRSLKKQERLIRVWDVPIAEARTTVIFETEDNCLWQLCDVGLGWTRFEVPKDNWTLNRELQTYMPTFINPRPALHRAWHYEIPLTKGTVLWVKPGIEEQTFRWGIRKHSS